MSGTVSVKKALIYLGEALPELDRLGLEQFIIDAIHGKSVRSKNRIIVRSSETVISRNDFGITVEHADPSERLKHYHKLSLLDLRSLVNKHATAVSKNKGGRPAEYDWEEFYIEIIRIADGQGLPSKQSDLVKQISQWCSHHWGKEPADSSIKSRISRIYASRKKSESGF